MPKDRKSNYLDILQIYRGIAALMVVVHHTVGSLRYYQNINVPVLNYLGNLGKYGVDFFFLLSGFIIAYSASYSYNKPNAFQKYITGRIMRIYIPYLPIGIAMIFLYTIFPDFSNSDREISIFTSLTLIPNGSPALSVAWTLLFELLFYFLFGMTFVSKKIWHYFITIWAVAIFIVNYSFLKPILHDANPILRVFMSLYNIEFIAGYLLAMLYIQKINVKLNYVWFFGLFSLAVFLLNLKFKFLMLRFSSNMVFSVFVFAMLYFSITRLKFRISRKNVFMLIGNATFSIYLLHNPLQMIVIRLFPSVSNGISLTFALLSAILISCVAGYLYSLVFEKKAMKAARKLIVDTRKKERIWT